MPTPEKIRKFYQSKLWRSTRATFVKFKRGICEECGDAGWEVHHKTPLSIINVDNLNISCGFDNLQLLCTSCHDSKRNENVYIRADLMFDEAGNVVKREVPPGGR